MDRPPRVPRFLLRLLSSLENNDAYIGDIEEIFAERAAYQGSNKALRWYWQEAVKAIPRFMADSIRWRIIMFRNYFKIAIRNIRKHKGYSMINIVGLAVGMACCILILLWVSDELGYDRFHENLDRLHRIVISSERGTFESSPWALIPALKRDYPEIVMGSWYSPRTILMKVEDRLYNETCALVAPEFLEMFTFPFIQGDPGTAFDNRHSIVLTEKTAQKYFGNENPLGKTVQFNGSVDLTVTGVMKNVPANSHMQFDCLTHPSFLYGESRLKTWSRDCPSYVMLSSAADPEFVSEKISGALIRYYKDTNTEYLISLQPIKKIHLSAFRGTDPIVYVYLFSIVAVIVLLIACINFTNLAMARSFKRAKEVGMRKVVGASRANIIRQFFGESFLLSSIAILISLLLVRLVLPAFNNLAQKDLALNFINHPILLVLLISITLVTGLIAGSYPALYLSSFQPVSIMKNLTGKGAKGQLIKKILIVFQFSAAIILIISTIMIFRQMSFIQNRDLGFDREQIVAVRTNQAVRGKYEVIKGRLLQNLDISNVTAASSIPLDIGNNNPVYWEGRGPEQYETINFVCVDYDYFETFGITMSHGRSFSREFPTDTGNYIINETALEMTGYEDPIGRMFSMWEQEGEIIGVVKDFHGTSLHNEIRPIVFLLYKNLPYFYMFAKIDSMKIPATIGFIETTIKQAAPDYVLDYFFLDEYFNTQYWREIRLKEILKYFTMLAVFVSCLGMLGLVSFMAEQRTKEVAIRKVLGARNANIVGILSREFLILVGIANLLAWPVSYHFLNKWIRGFAFHTNIGWWIFVLSGAAALIIAFCTVSFRSLRAAVADPVDSLRYE
jgi:putative ABC transport system permease protein